ncbi:Hsp20/alpha crystallin family protein [Mucilaginibacter xinganensis]|uniref:Acid shock protein n=1 Tax=Mucilaginibacter xinganensis TaxID=1234841 RepID=A0A223NY33_9SPHI|nr:Hsp20/alpha crystallin family protein [Mucilaginibacter xinganensis]ASU34777.1 Acid shock protein [Mucilaginibacter xinganensis]
MSTLVKSKKKGFPSLGSMMEDFWNADKFFNKPFFDGETLPAVNIINKKGHYQLDLAAPGFKKEDFKISTDGGVLTISAETIYEKNKENENYTRREFSRSSFTRIFNLPENVKEDDINAKYRDGLLSVELKKSGKDLPAHREIKID